VTEYLTIWLPTPATAGSKMLFDTAPDHTPPESMATNKIGGLLMQRVSAGLIVASGADKMVIDI
jgi:hypothetical protein